MFQSKSLSIVVPAFNEELNIEPTVRHILEAAVMLPDRFEVLIVNDCSTDRTYEIALRLAAQFPGIRVLNNPKNLGFGGAYKRGSEDAKLTYTVMIPGDDSFPVNSLQAIFREVGMADLVMTYPVNAGVRPLYRQLISRAFVVGMNLLFHLRLRYFNGVTVLPSATARQMKSSNGFSYAAENLVRLIKLRDLSYIEIPTQITERKAGNSKAFQLRNIVGVLWGLTVLFIDVYLRHALCQRSKS